MRLLLLAPFLLAVSCQDDEPDLWASTVWDPCGRGDPVASQHGPLAVERSHWITDWFGQEALDSEGEVPALLGDTRDAVVVPTPSQFFVELEKDDRPRRLSTAVRRLPTAAIRERAAAAVRCEVFLRTDDEVRSLAARTLAPPRRYPDAAWLPIEAEIPAGFVGRLDFVARLEDAALANLSGPPAAWANPLVTVAAEQALPSVVILTIDTLRADAVAHAPRIRAWMERGEFWPRAVSPSTWTLPSYATLFTGLETPDHGVGRGAFPDRPGEADPRDFRGLRPDLPTLAELFRRAGYATAMFHQNPFLEPWSGLDRGFARFTRLRDDTQIGVEAAREWWESGDPRPRFLVLHLMAPHLPYDPPPIAGVSDALPPDPLETKGYRTFLAGDRTPEQRRRFFDLPAEQKGAVRERYAAEVAAMDALVGPWLDELLGGEDPPLVAIHSDHGEEHWEEGSFEHGHGFAASVIFVPLALVWPGQQEPRRHEALASVTHLAPTLARMTLARTPGVELPASWTGDLFASQGEARCLGTLYRASLGGRAVNLATGALRDIGPEEIAPSWGPPAELDAGLRRALSELGYVSED